MALEFKNLDDAYNFLGKSGASSELLVHVRLVGEAAEILIEKLYELKIPFDAEFVRFGIALHDAGKIIHPSELSEQGNFHEADGEKLLIENGIGEKLARCCQSHGKWQTLECSFEEYLIALADKLWKGKRENLLEKIVIDKAADLSNQDRWEIFVALDSCFEEVASKGDERLFKSRNY